MSENLARAMEHAHSVEAIKERLAADAALAYAAGVLLKTLLA